MCYTVLSPLLALGGEVFGVSALSFVVIGEGFFLLRNGEAAGGGLLRVLLVEFFVLLLERGGIEAGGEDGAPSYDVRPGDQLFGVLVKHGLLDGVFQRFDLCFGLFEQFFKGLDLFDLGNDFSG